MVETASTNVAAAAPEEVVPAKISWVYHARGLAIILIVYRHIVLGMKASGVPVSQLMDDLQMVFFNFRMPAFFILSGVFIAKSVKRRPAKTVAGDKARTLLYPYILWAIITLLLQITFRQFSNARRHWDDFFDIIIQPRTLDQLWYLLALFNASVLYLLLRSVLAKRPWVHFLIAVGLHFSSFFVQPYSLFSDFFYFYFYFYTGALISNYLLDAAWRANFFKTPYTYLALPLFIIGQWYWFTHKEQTGVIELVFIAINFVGCYVLFTTAMVLARGTKSEWLATIGTYSLYIYILHVQTAAIVRKLVRGVYHQIDPWLLLLICVACGILIPIVLIKSLRKFGIERLFTLQRSRAT